MDERTIDALSRVAAAARSRRNILRALGGSALGAVLARLGAVEADAKPKKCKKPKKPGQKCKLKNGAKCKCSGGAHCKGGVCTCPNGTEEIHGTCVPAPTCLENGADCSDGSSAACCSGFCTYEYVGPITDEPPTCCVPNNEACDQTSDCCVNELNPSLCESGRCCAAEGAICADPTGFQNQECCLGLTCDADGTHLCG
jgi:hypothetical protein